MVARGHKELLEPCWFSRFTVPKTLMSFTSFPPFFSLFPLSLAPMGRGPRLGTAGRGQWAHCRDSLWHRVTQRLADGCQHLTPLDCLLDCRGLRLGARRGT